MPVTALDDAGAQVGHAMGTLFAPAAQEIRS
jgi:hypothetical protein